MLPTAALWPEKSTFCMVQMQKAHALSAQLETIYSTKGVEADAEDLLLVLCQPSRLFGIELNGVGLRSMTG